MQSRAGDGGNGSGGPSSQRLRERMYKLGEKAYKDADHKFQPTSELFLTSMLTDEQSTDLLWEFFHIYFPQRFSAFFAEIAKRHHHKIDPEARKAASTTKASAKPAQQKSYVRHEERAKAANGALLRTKLIQLADGNWITLYEATREQALSYAERLPAEGRAIQLLAHPLPPGARVGEWYPDSRDAEVRAIYKLAQDQTP
jgi:hypothetical protein